MRTRPRPTPAALPRAGRSALAGLGAVMGAVHDWRALLLGAPPGAR